MGSPFSKLIKKEETVRQVEDKHLDLESSLSDAQYNLELKLAISETFVSYVIPLNILHVFHKYNRRVLVRQDIEFVKAQVMSSGDVLASRVLLDRLIIYDDWFHCLLDSLRDSEVMLSHVAVQLENIREDFDERIIVICGAEVPREIESDSPTQNIYHSYHQKEAVRLKVKLEHVTRELNNERKIKERYEAELKLIQQDNRSTDSQPDQLQSDLQSMRNENTRLQKELDEEKEKVRNLDQEKELHLSSHLCKRTKEGKKKRNKQMTAMICFTKSTVT